MQKAIDTLWGIAIADALGNHLEFQSDVTRADLLAEAKKPVLYPSDDTQMTLFNYEGLLNTWGVNESALAWYRTQTYSKPAPGQGLSQFQSLYRREAPGSTCISACHSLWHGEPVDNDSKGNGTVMRASPFAVYGTLKGWSVEQMFLAAKHDAQVTHKHTMAWQSSVLLVAIYLNLFNGQPFKVAVLQAMQSVPATQDAAAEVAKVVYNPGHMDNLLSRRSGWVAEEALAMAVGSVLYSKADFMDITATAVSGVATDSDTVASIAGGLAVASGIAYPQHLAKRLYCADAIEYITKRLQSTQ